MNEILWQPQEGPQTEFCKSIVYEVLIGGAAGGGKSDVLLLESLRQIDIPEYRAIIFRRQRPQLRKLIDRSLELFPKIGAEWKDSKNTWIFPGGAQLILSHMEHEKNKYDHDGQEYHYIGFDELTHFSETQYTYLVSRNRSAHPDLNCYIRASAMPIGTGITWVKQRFIDNGPYTILKDPETGLERQFIPAILEDNRILIANDTTYDNKLKLLGPKLYKALRKGDWSVIQGAAFEELDFDVHSCKPHLPPEGVHVWRAFDWGYAKPFSIGWYYENHDKCIVRFKEWYGCVTGKADTGLRMLSSKVGEEIAKIDKELKCYGGVADPSIWGKDDDIKSVGDSMRDEGVIWQPAINDRIQGKMEFHERLRVDEEGLPMFKVTEDCKHFWRTIPVLQTDEKKPEDVDTKMEDHLYDEVRYSMMSKPLLKGNGEISVGTPSATGGSQYDL